MCAAEAKLKSSLVSQVHPFTDKVLKMQKNAAGRVNDRATERGVAEVQMVLLPSTGQYSVVHVVQGLGGDVVVCCWGTQSHTAIPTA